MILADKIIQLRKKQGWSQEELAEQLNVSRQAVSKWEGAQATPDLSKLLAMSQLFGVTTDYLLKDDMEAEEYAKGDDTPALRRVTLREANEYIAWREKASKLIAGGVLLCILGVIALILLGVWGDMQENALLTGLGVCVLIVCIALAVGLFIYCGHKNSPYEFLAKEDFDTEYGVQGIAEKKREEGQRTYMTLLIAGIGLCVLSVIPILCASFLQLSDLYSALLVALMLLMAGLGAALCVVAGVRRSSLDQLLKQGDYSAQGKRRSRLTGPISAAFWLLTTAVYLIWLLTNPNANSISWVVWPVAGVLYGAVMALCSALTDKKQG